MLWIKQVNITLWNKTLYIKFLIRLATQISATKTPLYFNRNRKWYSATERATIKWAHHPQPGGQMLLRMLDLSLSSSFLSLGGVQSWFRQLIRKELVQKLLDELTLFYIFIHGFFPISLFLLSCCYKKINKSLNCKTWSVHTSQFALPVSYVCIRSVSHKCAWGDVAVGWCCFLF